MAMQFASINLSTVSGNLVVSGGQYPNQRLRVINYTVLSSVDANLKFQSQNTLSGFADITGPMAIAAKGGLSPSAAHVIGQGGVPLGLFETKLAGDSLYLNTTASGVIGGHLCFFTIQ